MNLDFIDHYSDVILLNKVIAFGLKRKLIKFRDDYLNGWWSYETVQSSCLGIALITHCSATLDRPRL